VDLVAHFLTHGLPECFLPPSLPLDTHDGYTILELCSVQARVWVRI